MVSRRPARKSARAALIELDQPTIDVLAECFQQFGIDTIPLPRNEIERMHLDPYDACVLYLDESAARILEVARGAPGNFQMMIFGIAASHLQALQFSRYGINAILDEPVQKEAVLQLLEDTHLFVVREFRRYIRIPLITTVNVFVEGKKLTAMGEELSSGGMAIALDTKLPIGLHLEVEFALPNASLTRVPASVRWLRPGLVGVRFDENHPARRAIKQWIEKYLGIV